MGYAGSKRRFRVEPYALVAKGVVWYLVGRTRDFRTYRVDRVTDVDITDDRFEREPSFNLEAHWRDVCDNFANRLPEYLVHLRVRGPAVARLGWSSRVLELSEPGETGWHDATIDTESEHEAASIVLSLAPNVIVISPATVAATTNEAARVFASHQSSANPMHT